MLSMRYGIVVCVFNNSKKNTHTDKIAICCKALNTLNISLDLAQFSKLNHWEPVIRRNVTYTFRPGIL